MARNLTSPLVLRLVLEISVCNNCDPLMFKNFNLGLETRYWAQTFKKFNWNIINKLNFWSDITTIEDCQTPLMHDIVYFLRKCWYAKSQHCAVHFLRNDIGGAKLPKGMPCFLRKFGMGIPNFWGCQIICDSGPPRAHATWRHVQWVTNRLHSLDLHVMKCAAAYLYQAGAPVFFLVTVCSEPSRLWLHV